MLQYRRVDGRKAAGQRLAQGDPSARRFDFIVLRGIGRTIRQADPAFDALVGERKNLGGEVHGCCCTVDPSMMGEPLL